MERTIDILGTELQALDKIVELLPQLGKPELLYLIARIQAMIREDEELSTHQYAIHFGARRGTNPR